MFDRYLDFQGRLGRKDYFFNLLKFILVAPVFAMGATLVAVLTARFVTEWLGVVLGVVAVIAYVYWSIRFSLSQGAKRAHDLGHSGWASLLLVVPVVAFFASLYFFFAPGQEHDNAYGARNNG